MLADLLDRVTLSCVCTLVQIVVAMIIPTNDAIHIVLIRG
jgi:hypothetical protein